MGGGGVDEEVVDEGREREREGGNAIEVDVDVEGGWEHVGHLHSVGAFVTPDQYNKPIDHSSVLSRLKPLYHTESQRALFREQRSHRTQQSTRCLRKAFGSYSEQAKKRR